MIVIEFVWVRTLIEWMQDTSFMASIRKFQPLFLGLTDDEVGTNACFRTVDLRLFILTELYPVAVGVGGQNSCGFTWPTSHPGSNGGC